MAKQNGSNGEKKKGSANRVFDEVLLFLGYLIALAVCLGFVYLFDRAVHVRPPGYGIIQFYKDFLGAMLGTQEGRSTSLWIALAVFGPYLFFQGLKMGARFFKPYFRK